MRPADRLVVIGCSWGGLKALPRILSELPEDFGAAVVVVQHRAARTGMESLESFHAKQSRLPLVSIEDKEPILPARVYLAPADYHVIVEEGAFALSTEPHVQFSRPSIDVTFESAAHVYGRQVVGVILTGANEDGAAGLTAIKGRGGFAIVQEPQTATRREMPEAALAAVEVDEVLPLDDIPHYLVKLIGEAA